MLVSRIFISVLLSLNTAVDTRFETFGLDGPPVAVRPNLGPGRMAGPIGVLVYVLFLNFMNIRSKAQATCSRTPKAK